MTTRIGLVVEALRVRAECRFGMVRQEDGTGEWARHTSSSSVARKYLVKFPSKPDRAHDVLIEFLEAFGRYPEFTMQIATDLLKWKLT